MNHTEFVNVVLPFTPHFVIVLRVFEQLFAAVGELRVVTVAFAFAVGHVNVPEKYLA